MPLELQEQFSGSQDFLIAEAGGGNNRQGLPRFQSPDGPQSAWALKAI